MSLYVWMDGTIEYPLQEVLYQGESIFLYRVTRFQASTVHENPILRPNQSPYIIVGLWTQILLQHIKLTTVVRFWCLRSPDMILGNSNYKKNKIFKTLANRGPFTPAPDEVQKKPDLHRISAGFPSGWIYIFRLPFWDLSIIGGWLLCIILTEPFLMLNTRQRKSRPPQKDTLELTFFLMR